MNGELLFRGLSLSVPLSLESFLKGGSFYYEMLGSFYQWFKNTKVGVWFQVKMDNTMEWVAKRYDIEIVTVHGLDPEGEPSAEDIAEVVEQISEEGITVLYVEEYTDQSAVSAIVDQTGVTVEILYTMEPVSYTHLTLPTNREV